MLSEQQYQKKFRQWKLNKNIGEIHWMVLIRALKRYGVAVEELDPQYGTIDIHFEGHPLEYTKIKKAIYRYDTSLRNAEPWSDNIHIDPVQQLEIILRNLITRFIMNDKDNQLRKILPEQLIGLILGLSYSDDLSDQLVSCHTWGLKRRSTDLPVISLSQNEKTVFTSCISSISNNSTRKCSFRACELSDLQTQWLAVLQENKIGLTPKECISIWLDTDEHIGQDEYLATNILMFCLILCLSTGSCLRSGVMKATETSRLLSVPSLMQRPQSIILLQTLLLTMAGQGVSPLCAQLIASGVEPNAVRPHPVLFGGGQIPLTALQMSLGVGPFANFRFEPEVVLRLLKADADPNICGSHGQNQPGRLICCTMLPIYLALKHPLPTFQALIDAGAYVPEGINLTTAIQEITDAEVLSALLPDRDKTLSVSSEGGSGRFWYESYLCPLQAVVSLGRQEIALKLLEKLVAKRLEKSSEQVLDPIEPSLGCSLTRLAQALAGRGGSSAWNSTDRSIFRTPLTYAILNDLPEVAGVLLANEAHISKSYFDHLLWNHPLRQKGLHFSSLSHYLHHTSASPLQAAVWDENISAIQFALDTGADPNYSFSIGVSPLALARWRNNQTIACLLRRYHARISPEDVHRCRDTVEREKRNLKEQRETLESDLLIMEIVSCRSSKNLLDIDPKAMRRKLKQTKNEIEEMEVRIKSSEGFIDKLSS